MRSKSEYFFDSILRRIDGLCFARVLFSSRSSQIKLSVSAFHFIPKFTTDFAPSHSRMFSKDVCIVIEPLS